MNRISVQDSAIQKRTCHVCKETEQRVGPMETDACWTGKSSYTEVVGKTISLKVYNISNAPIYYRSSNPAAASVSGDGKVTLKKGGKAIIYAYTKGNGRYRPTEMQISIQVVDLYKRKEDSYRLRKKHYLKENQQTEKEEDLLRENTYIQKSIRKEILLRMEPSEKN